MDLADSSSAFLELRLGFCGARCHGASRTLCVPLGGMGALARNQDVSSKKRKEEK